MSSASRTFPVRALVLCALFAALTAVCAQVIIPIGPVPVSLSLLGAETLPGNALWLRYAVRP